jgi:hypothetical protein
MKTKSIIVITLMLGCIILALPNTVQATAPEPLTIEADLWMTGENSAAGYFSTSGLFSDGGDASEVFKIAGTTIHGVKTLEGANGTITIKFQAQLSWDQEGKGYANGSFVILSGTGAYKKLHGVGQTYAEINLVTYQISATYTGTAHFD